MSFSSLRSFEYLERLPATVLFRLYKQPSAVLAIFRRMLPHLAKAFVMQVLFSPVPTLVAELDTLVRENASRERNQAIQILERLHIFSVVDVGKSKSYRLSDAFAQSLRMGLTGCGDHNSFGVLENSPDSHHTTVAELDEYAKTQWERVLGYMVGSTNTAMINSEEQISPSVRGLLEIGNLIITKGRRPEITKDGFAFVLQEVNSQIWTILVFYLENAENLSMDPVEVLSFLFMLGSLELGQAYRKASLTPTQMQMLDDLADFGIIYQHSPKSSRFYPTRLATTLTSDSNALKGMSISRPGNNKGFIIIETNYRVYAYTSSDLEIAVLGLFTKLGNRFPNLVLGKITRESIRHAISMGITSDQIIAYLSEHAHPQMHKTNPVLPPTVVDQIRLWQIEGERMKTTPGFLFKEFTTPQEYLAACKVADDNGVLVYRNDAKKCFFVTRHEPVAQYLQRAKTKKTEAGT